MNILFYDFETQGLPLWEIPSEDPKQPHIVQLGAILVNAETMEELAVVELIVKPDGWTIPDEVAAIHGITTERALAEGIPEKEVIQKLMELWPQSDLRVAHVESFDARIARIAIKRFFTDALADAFKESPAQCTGKLTKPIMQMQPKTRYGYKTPKLIEAYKHFTGKDLEGAHTALADTRACMEVYFAVTNPLPEAVPGLDDLEPTLHNP